MELPSLSCSTSHTVSLRQKGVELLQLDMYCSSEVWTVTHLPLTTRCETCCKTIYPMDRFTASQNHNRRSPHRINASPSVRKVNPTNCPECKSLPAVQLSMHSILTVQLKPCGLPASQDNHGDTCTTQTSRRMPFNTALCSTICTDTSHAQTKFMADAEGIA